jgi:hypothetical protein
VQYGRLFRVAIDLYIVYAERSTREQFTGIPLIHIESVQFSSNLTYEVTVRGAEARIGYLSNGVFFDPNKARGFAVSVRSPGNYTMCYAATDGSSSGFMMYDNMAIFAALAANDTMYADAEESDGDANCSAVATNVFTVRGSLQSHNTKRIIKFSTYTFMVWKLW